MVPAVRVQVSSVVLRAALPEVGLRALAVVAQRLRLWLHILLVVDTKKVPRLSIWVLDGVPGPKLAC